MYLSPTTSNPKLSDRNFRLWGAKLGEDLGLDGPGTLPFVGKRFKSFGLRVLGFKLRV